MTLTDLLKSLARQGCYPAIIRRGKSVWRAHVNAAGNYWADANTPYRALHEAVKLWKKAGKPVDGMAAIVTKTEPSAT